MKKSHGPFRSWLAMGALCVTASVAEAQSFQMVDLGSLGGDSSAMAINERGQITGNSWDAAGMVKRAFLYSGGTMRGLSQPDQISVGNALNNRGQVAGTYFFGPVRGWEPTIFSGGAIQGLGSLAPGNYSEARAINDLGQVTGSSWIGGAGGGHAFVYDGGVLHDIGTLGGVNSVGTAITADGRVAGSSVTSLGTEHAFLYSQGTMTDIGGLGGGLSQATGINEAGTVVGWGNSADRSFGMHAWVYSGGVMHDIGARSDWSWAYGINASGVVVGTLTDSAFVYANGHMTDLNSLIDPASAAGWKLVDAQDINDAGQIVGTARLGDERYGISHAVLLNPVPEPATWLLMLLGVGCVASVKVARSSIPENRRVS